MSKKVDDRKDEELTAERLEEKIVPALINPKKGPVPPPYPPGADYSLIRRRNLYWVD